MSEHEEPGEMDLVPVARRWDRAAERKELTALRKALREIIDASRKPNPGVLLDTIGKHRHLVGAEPT